MSAWGNLDNVLITGNVSSATTRDYLDGYQTQFLLDVDQGDYIVFAGNKYQVANVTSNTVLHLTGLAATNSSNVDAFVQQGPKYISNVASDPANVLYSIQNIYGIDRNEVGVPENEARGISHTGWNHYITYTGAHGTRHKAEVLVAMSKNFASNATGELFADVGSFDAADDAVAADYLLYFVTQPSNVVDYLANLSGANVTVVAASEPAGAAITFQWSRADNATAAAAGTFNNLSNGAIITGTTSATLYISNTSGLDGNVLRCTISAAGTGADNNVSDQVSITISA